ncbi:hypothetical protein NFI96_011155 [Prochilodus magdalenae]|nr:hypothetical protein NFI96_011155 [Prochilodus magdalenae]
MGKRKLNKGAVPRLFAWNDYSMPAPRLNVWQRRPRCPSPVLAASDTDQEMEVQIAPDHDYCVTPTTSAMADALANENEALKRKRQELQHQLEASQLQSRFGLQRLAGSDEDIRFYTSRAEHDTGQLCVCVGTVDDGVMVVEDEREQSLEQQSVGLQILTQLLHNREQQDSSESERKLYDSTAGTSDVSDMAVVRASEMETTAQRLFHEEDMGPEQLDFRPQRAPGVYLQTKSYSPLELFKLFFNHNLMKNIVENTNQKDSLSSGQLFDKPLNVKEFYRFVGLLLYMWYVKAPTISDYWSSHQLYRFELPSDVMTKSRFEAIHQRLHISDPKKAKANKSKIGKQGYDPLYEIRPLLIDVAAACKTHFHPDRNLTISERVFREHSGSLAKTSERSDPKVGIKVLAISDYSTGYIWNISVYRGAIDSSSGEVLDFEFIRHLANPVLLGSGYHVYVKNAYTTPDMFKRFKSSCHSSLCGPVRLNAKGFPCTQKNNFTEDAKRGSVCWIRQDDLLFVKWISTEEVALCSTMHKVHSDEDSTDHESEHVSNPSLTPLVIKDYNKYTRTSHRYDSVCSYHWQLQKDKTWDKAFFYYALDVACNNSFLLNQEMKLSRTAKSLNQNDFIEGLILQLTSYGKYLFRTEKATEQLEKGNHPQTSHPAPPPPPRAPQACMPVFFDVGIKSLCVQCKLCETNMRCKGCSVALCLTAERNCFQDWHISKGVAQPL